MTLSGRQVLITSVGSGTGAALAGARVVIAGRRMEALERVAAGADGINGQALTRSGGEV